MADIELIVKIPKIIYKQILKCHVSKKTIAKIFRNGTPQKTGHWIDDKCSACGKGIENLIDSREWYRNEEPKFCPFCGMPLEWESEEN